MLLSGDLSQTFITSARLTIRAFIAEDAAESFAEANARVAKFMSRNPPASEMEFRTIWQRGISDMKTGKGLHLVLGARMNLSVAPSRWHLVGNRNLDQGVGTASWIWARGRRRCD
jgi:hypothetical protein